MGCQALVHLLDAFLRLSCLLRQCPATQESTTRPPDGKSLCCGEAHGGFGTLLGGMPLAAYLMEHGSKAQDKIQAKGMCTLLRQGYRLLAPCQPLRRIAQEPQRPGSIDVANHPRVL